MGLWCGKVLLHIALEALPFSDHGQQGIWKWNWNCDVQQSLDVTSGAWQGARRQALLDQDSSAGCPLNIAGMMYEI